MAAAIWAWVVAGSRRNFASLAMAFHPSRSVWTSGKRACAQVKRDPATITRSVNLHFHMGADEAGAQVARDKLQKFPSGQRLGAVTGTAPEVIDRIAEYME